MAAAGLVVAQDVSAASRCWLQVCFLCPHRKHTAKGYAVSFHELISSCWDPTWGIWRAGGNSGALEYHRCWWLIR